MMMHEASQQSLQNPAPLDCRYYFNQDQFNQDQDSVMASMMARISADRPRAEVNANYGDFGGGSPSSPPAAHGGHATLFQHASTHTLNRNNGRT